MRRFFLKTDSSFESGETVALPEGESRHISRVLRLEEGTAIELIDGRGTVYSAEISCTGRIVKAKITHAEKRLETGCRLIVGQGILKGKKMDTVIQKCTELGVNDFIPFISSRCQGKPGDLRAEKRLSRYERVVEAACKQCFRADLMTVEAVQAYRDMFLDRGLFGTEPESEMKLLFWEEEHSRTLHDIVFPETVRQVCLLLGPEGGFTHEEVEEAQRCGFLPVSLGSRILRAETATLTAVAITQYLARNI